MCVGGSHCDLPLSQSRLLLCGFLPVEEVFGSNVSRLQTVEITLGLRCRDHASINTVQPTAPVQGDAEQCQGPPLWQG